MNIDPEVVDMFGKVAGVNVVAALLLAVMSYGLSALMLNGLTALDRWLDPSRNEAKRALLDAKVDPGTTPLA